MALAHFTQSIRTTRVYGLICTVFVILFGFSAWGEEDMWQRAKGYENLFRFSTLFIAQDVRDHLSTPQGIDEALEWCKQTGITRVFVEVFRDGYTAEKERLIEVRDRFRNAGFLVSGCVTPTGMGVASNGWKAVSNYEEPATLKECERIFAYAASLFDEIMIDDFLFTDDTSPISEQARGSRSWSEYRNDLMLRVSREFILAPAREVNPRVEIIIKYPQWYDNFHNRGYNVGAQTDLFDKIWVGTETRDPDNAEWGRKAQYEAFYIMRWLTDVGQEKTDGGWFDPYGASAQTYVEQARQTILGGAREAMLFHYGELRQGQSAKNVEALRQEMPGLFLLAEAVAEAKPTGILAPKVPNSDAPKEMYIYDFFGMLGLPLVPLGRIDTSYSSAFFATQSWQESVFPDSLSEFLEEKKPVALTHHLRDLLAAQNIELPSNVQIVTVPAEPRDLYEIDAATLQNLRRHLLKPLGINIDGPTRVSLYLFDNGLAAVENFRDEEVEFAVAFDNPLTNSEIGHAQKTFFALPQEKAAEASIKTGEIRFHLQPRSLAVVKLGAERF